MVTHSQRYRSLAVSMHRCGCVDTDTGVLCFAAAPAGKPRFGPPRMISIRTPGSKSRRTTKELLKQMEHAAQQMVEDSLKDIEFDTCTNIPVDGTGRAIQWDFDIEVSEQCSCSLVWCSLEAASL